MNDLNDYGYPKYTDYYRLDRELSRADFALLAIVLGFFTAIMGSSLGNAHGLGDLVVRGGVTAILGVSALASLRGAILWGSATKEAERQAENVTIPRRAFKADLFHTQSGKI